MHGWSCSRHLLYIPLVSLASPTREGAAEKEGVVVGAEEGTAMRRGRWILGAATCAMALAILIGFHAGSAQDVKGKKPPATPAVYNPYPPGILPGDLDSEIARVSREVNFIFRQALAQWRALPPPNLTGQPPTLQGSGYDMVQTLGKLMNFDEKMSVFKNQACASCHMPYAGFSGPIPSVNLTMVAFPGSFHFRAGKRTAQ